MTCLFCNLPSSRIVDSEGPVFAILDAFPVSRGHTLIIPFRHSPDFFALSPDEWSAALRLAQRRAAALRLADPSISGFNFGINAGADAGQTVFHTHLHLIPRRHGDHPSPRGGVRGIFPGRASYPDSRVAGAPFSSSAGTE